MKSIRQHLFASVAFAAMAMLSAPNWAQGTNSVVGMTEAEVRKVDRENKKITLKHGAIKSLDMPPMTMVFGVNDPAILDKVQVGDKVQFTATHDSGRFTVIEMQPAK